MDHTIVTSTKGINWKELATVFERAPLGRRNPDKLRRAFCNSHAVTIVYKGDEIIGAGRAVSDGVYQAVIYDIVVLPDHQNNGVGKIIMESIMERLGDCNILLYAAPGKEGFYENQGFGRLLTGMGKFREKEKMQKEGYIR